MTTGFNLNLALAKHDFYAPRTAPLGGYYVRVPASFNLGAFVSSGYLAYDVNAGLRAYALDERLARPRRLGYGLTLSPRYRLSDQLNSRYSFNYALKVSQIGYVNDDFALSLLIDQKYGDQLGADVLLGRRRVYYLGYLNLRTRKG